MFKWYVNLFFFLFVFDRCPMNFRLLLLLEYVFNCIMVIIVYKFIATFYNKTKYMYVFELMKLMYLSNHKNITISNYVCYYPHCCVIGTYFLPKQVQEKLYIVHRNFFTKS
jgi:hypothetical protein